MFPRLLITASVGLALVFGASNAQAQHGHGGHGGHGGHVGHGFSHGGHGFSHAGHGYSHGGHGYVHGGHGYLHGGHSYLHGGYGYSHGGHGYLHGGYGLGLGYGHLYGYGYLGDYGHHHHLGWQHYLPYYYDRYHHGAYYCDSGVNYYLPYSYVVSTRSYAPSTPVVVNYGGYSHVDDLSDRLVRLANSLCLDLYYNYRHNPGYPETYRAAYQILTTAKYIHDNQSDREEIARQLNELDLLFHSLRDGLASWSRQAVRQVGPSDVQGKLADVEATLHHLMNDVGVKGAHQNPADAGATETAPPPPESVPPPTTVPATPPA